METTDTIFCSLNLLYTQHHFIHKKTDRPPPSTEGRLRVRKQNNGFKKQNFKISKLFYASTLNFISYFISLQYCLRVLNFAIAALICMPDA